MAKLLMQGAEAKVYKTRWLDRDVIVKQRFGKKYRHPELDKQISQERIKAEAKALVRCKSIGLNVPAVYDVNLISQEIVMEEVKDCKQVREYMCDKGDNLTDLASKIGSVVGKLHSHHIIHGDLTTSNMLLIPPYDSSDIYLIDFGFSSVSEHIEDKGVDLYLLERAILSTHPHSENFVEKLLEIYESCAGRDSKKVINKLNEVRQRGRKKLCFG